MKEKDVAAASAALKKELTDSIIKKIDQIRENIVIGKGSDKSSYFQTLISIDEELDDVLLNWEYSPINIRLSFPGSDDLDDLDDDY